jgi:hypothetical protein
MLSPLVVDREGPLVLKMVGYCRTLAREIIHFAFESILGLGCAVPVAGRTPSSPFLCRATLSWSPLTLEFVQTIQRRNFVSFGERGIVKYGIAEVFDRSTHRKNRLTDVNDFRGAVANYMYP